MWLFIFYSLHYHPEIFTLSSNFGKSRHMNLILLILQIVSLLMDIDNVGEIMLIKEIVFLAMYESIK